MTSCADDNVILPACIYMSAKTKPISPDYYFYSAFIGTDFTLFLCTDCTFGE
jgi:hypothetical protein